MWFVEGSLFTLVSVNPRLSWLKKKEPCGLALVGYEPNAARVGPAMDPGMRRRRARSLDAGDEGIMVAEPNGEVIPEEEVMEGEAESGGHGGAVPVNPFWSEKARAEAELQALRPKDLPRVPEGETAEAHRGEPHGHDRDQEGWHKADTRSSSRSEFWSDVKRSLQEDLERENWPKGEAERGRGSGSDGHRGHPGGWPPEARHGDHPGGHRGWGREHGGEHPREYPGRGQAEHRVQGEGHHWGEYEGNPRGEYEGRPTERAEGGLAGAHGGRPASVGPHPGGRESGHDGREGKGVGHRGRHPIYGRGYATRGSTGHSRERKEEGRTEAGRDLPGDSVPAGGKGPAPRRDLPGDSVPAGGKGPEPREGEGHGAKEGRRPQPRELEVTRDEARAATRAGFRPMELHMVWNFQKKTYQLACDMRTRAGL